MPVSALLTADDLTQTEQLRRLEVEAANLRLIKSMSDRLAHEIGNALVPLATHQQLLAEKYQDKEFRESLDQALADGVKRVTRLINQMRFLAREGHIEQETFTVQKLIEEAYQEARKHQSADAGKLQFDNGGKPVVITGDRAALKHALAEIMLNALQANPKEPKIGVKLHTDADSGGAPDVQIEVQDNGAGFTAEAAQKAPAPFFTTRNVGLGLGLTVSRKIIETHRGKLEIVPPSAGPHGSRPRFPADGLRHFRHGVSGGLGAVVADGLDRTAFLGFLAAAFFFRRRRLFEDERVSAVFVAFEIVRRRLAAQVAVNALVVHVVFARDVFGIFVCHVSHKISF